VGRVLGILGKGDLGWTGEQATVVAGDLQALEGAHRPRRQCLEPDGVVVDVDEVLHRDAAVVRAADDGAHVGGDLRVAGHLVRAGLEAAEAGGARHRDRVELHVLLDLDELVDGQGRGEQAVDGVRRRVAATLPARDLDEVEPERPRRGPEARVELGRGAVQ